MASGQPGSSSQQPFSYPHTALVVPAQHVASPPTKQSLKTWAKWFKAPQKTQETQGNELFLAHSDSGIANPPNKQIQQKKKKLERKPKPCFPPSIFVDLYIRKSIIPRNLTSVFMERIMDNFSLTVDGVPDVGRVPVVTTVPFIDGVFDVEEAADGPSSSQLRAPTTLSGTVRKISTRVFGRHSVLAPWSPEEDDTPSVDSSVLSSRYHTAKSASGSSSPPIKRDKVGRRSRLSYIANRRRYSSDVPRALRSPPPPYKPKPLSIYFAVFACPRAASNSGAMAKQSDLADNTPPVGIFGVPLRQSITYANVAISLVDPEGKSYIYGYVPIVVAKCGVYLKEKATNVEGIFRLAGSEKRIKELRKIFDSPDRYGKGLNWDGYTVHDAANVLRRYLNLLPEPIVPLDLYDQFRAPLKGYTKQAVGDNEGAQASDSFDVAKAITTYQNLITELPPLNRQLLLYILDLLAVFASKADENRMNSQNLAAIFQPGMLSHPNHDMAPQEYRLSQDVLIFLIENQDHFLIGMRGTAADEQTVQQVQNGGTPPPGTPNSIAKNNVRRSISNASAGADDVRKHGGLRRNVSVSSRHSRQSNGAPSPASPAFNSPSSGVHRSNTVPSKRSPAIPSSRLQKNSGSSSPSNGLVFAQPTVAENLAPANATNTTNVSFSEPHDPRAIAMGVSSLAPTSNPTSTTSQERLLPEAERQPLTPTREKPGFFGRSPTVESEKKAPNKLRKKRIPGSSNPSAQSSQQSLDGGQSAFAPSPLSNPVHETRDLEYKPLEVIQSASPEQSIAEPSSTKEPMRRQEPVERPIQEPRPERLEPQRPEEPHRTSDKTLKPVTSPASSLRSHSSLNDMSHSDVDHLDDVATEQKEKKSRWRMSRRREEPQTYGTNLTPRKGLGVDGTAAASSSSVGSSARPRKSFTGDSLPLGSESNLSTSHAQSSNESGSAHVTEDKKGPLGWIKNKIRENREREAEKERNKSPPASVDRLTAPFGSRGKSIDIKRDEHPTPIAEEPPLPKNTPQSQQPQIQAPGRVYNPGQNQVHTYNETQPQQAQSQASSQLHNQSQSQARGQNETQPSNEPKDSDVQSTPNPEPQESQSDGQSQIQSTPKPIPHSTEAQSKPQP